MSIGAKIWNSTSGVTLDPTLRMGRVAASGSTGTLANNTSINIFVSGFDNTDFWQAMVVPTDYYYAGFTITKNTGYFTVQNTSGQPVTFSYWAFNL
jgi:hypothetical protein